MLLMRVMIMEYNNLLFRNRYRLQWGAREALPELRHLRLTLPPKKNDPFDDAFHHSFYLATHVVYVQSAYNAIKANEREIPWLYRYVRQAFRYWMRQARLKESDSTSMSTSTATSVSPSSSIEPRGIEPLALAPLDRVLAEGDPTTAVGADAAHRALGEAALLHDRAHCDESHVARR